MIVFPDVSMVLMADGTVLPISMVDRFDEVFDVDCGPVRPWAITSGSFDADLAYISVGMNASPLICTGATKISSRVLRSGRMTSGWFRADEIRVGDMLEVYDKENPWKIGTVLHNGSVYWPVEYVSTIKYRGGVTSLSGMQFTVDGFVVS